MVRKKAITKIYLGPSFLGFTRLGSNSYFHQVSAAIERSLVAKGIFAEMIEVYTIPTGSIRHRAKRLIDSVRATGGMDCENLQERRGYCCKKL